ncbi:sodium:proton antiporter [Rubrobacter indicoceani]|uniref:sodium:proton antiporter n=1 Tax=Rubrobacter indicoceani TaxID=2051957 RepID=UPI000E5B90D5|nr:NADH-quinone oxidoreductase subunit K [Rubrobacter indicoceani]
MGEVEVYLVSGVLIFVVCAYALVVHAHLIRKVLALNIMGSGIFLLFTAIARRTDTPDPVPHAMVLTGIVVAVSATAFALALVRKLHQATGRPYLPEEPDRSPRPPKETRRNPERG